MKALNILLILTLALSAINARADDPNLLVDGGTNALLALKDSFSIDYSDQVSDGCLPQPTKMKDKMELVLRQNGLGISKDDQLAFLKNKIAITAVGFATSSNSCAINVEAVLMFYVNILVPYAQDVPSSQSTIVPFNYSLGSVLLTGSKYGMQERVETQIKDFGEKLYLDVSRARDQVQEQFPEIFTRYKSNMGKL